MSETSDRLFDIVRGLDAAKSDADTIQLLRTAVTSLAAIAIGSEERQLRLEELNERLIAHVEQLSSALSSSLPERD